MCCQGKKNAFASHENRELMCSNSGQNVWKPFWRLCSSIPIQFLYHNSRRLEDCGSPRRQWGRTEPGWWCSSAVLWRWHPSPSDEAQMSAQSGKKLRFQEWRLCCGDRGILRTSSHNYTEWHTCVSMICDTDQIVVQRPIWHKRLEHSVAKAYGAALVVWPSNETRKGYVIFK